MTPFKMTLTLIAAFVTTASYADIQYNFNVADNNAIQNQGVEVTSAGGEKQTTIVDQNGNLKVISGGGMQPATPAQPQQVAPKDSTNLNQFQPAPNTQQQTQQAQPPVLPDSQQALPQAQQPVAGASPNVMPQPAPNTNQPMPSMNQPMPQNNQAMPTPNQSMPTPTQAQPTPNPSMSMPMPATGNTVVAPAQPVAP